MVSKQEVIRSLGQSSSGDKRARALLGSETQPDILAHDLNRELGLTLDQAHRLIAEADTATPLPPSSVPDWPMRRTSDGVSRILILHGGGSDSTETLLPTPATAAGKSTV